MAHHVTDSELLTLIISYQTNPANPQATAALLGALEGLIRSISRTRTSALGGPQDARQETVAAVLSVAQLYHREDVTGVELRMMGDVADQLWVKTHRGTQYRKREKELNDEPLTPETPAHEVKIILDQAQQKGILRPQDRPLLVLWAGGLSYQEIANHLNEEAKKKRKNRRKKAPVVTAKAMELRIQKSLQALREWVKTF